MSMEFNVISLDMLTFLASVTEMLNKSPKIEGYYLHVELRRENAHTVVGTWTDEVSDTDWLFEQRDLEPEL